MGFWSVVGKVALVTVCPVAGLAVIGASSAAKYAGGKKAAEDRANRAEGELAKQSIILDRLKEKLEKVRLGDINRFHQFVVAASALGICVANCDGEIHPSERDDIEKFISGASAKSLPGTIVDQIYTLYQTPPTLHQAIEYIRPLANEHWDTFEDIIQTAVDADGREYPMETAFMEAWSQIASTLGKKSRFSRHMNVRRA